MKKYLIMTVCSLALGSLAHADCSSMYAWGSQDLVDCYRADHRSYKAEMNGVLGQAMAQTDRNVAHALHFQQESWAAKLEIDCDQESRAGSYKTEQEAYWLGCAIRMTKTRTNELRSKYDIWD